MKINHFIVTIAILLVIMAVFGAAAFALNLYTGPIIEANNAGAELAPLLAVMPEGASFGSDALVYDANNASASTLVDVPETVLSVYKEANGLGYVIRCTAVSSYSEAPMEITIGIDAEGKICGIQLDSYFDSVDFREKDANYISSYVGKDSALADIGTVSGATYSSTAFKGAVEGAMGVLIKNELIAEGVKSDDQILTELIPSVAPGFSKLLDATATGSAKAAFKAENDTGYAYIMAENGANYLAVVNAMGVCKVYDTTGADVTADHSALADEAKASAAAAQTNFLDKLTTKLERMMPEASEVTELKLDVFNTVVSAVSFKLEGVNYYAFYSRSVGFHQMDVYFVIDENGAIVKMDAAQFIFDEEYFMAFGGMDVGAYKEGFVGMTGETWNGDKAIIATATMTSNAMKQSTADAFAAFDSIKGGEQ